MSALLSPPIQKSSNPRDRESPEVVVAGNQVFYFPESGVTGLIQFPVALASCDLPLPPQVLPLLVLILTHTGTAFIGLRFSHTCTILQLHMCSVAPMQDLSHVTTSTLQ